MAVYFWVEVTESGLQGTYLTGTGVGDKWLVDSKMDASHKIELFLAIIIIYTSDKCKDS